MNVRHLEERDYDPIIAVLDDWFGGRPLAKAAAKGFLRPFSANELCLEEDGKVIAFLTGFVSQTYADDAYIHFVGWRNSVKLARFSLCSAGCSPGPWSHVPDRSYEPHGPG